MFGEEEEVNKAGFGKPVEGRLPNGTIKWKVEGDGATIRLDSEYIPESDKGEIVLLRDNEICC